MFKGVVKRGKVKQVGKNRQSEDIAWELIKEMSLHATHQGMHVYSHLSSLSHFGLILF